jgi:biotin carboxyl carrier protein
MSTDDVFKVLVNSDYQFDVTPQSLLEIDILSTNKEELHILQGNKSIQATIQHIDFNKRIYQFIINGNEYQVNINTALDALISKMGLGVIEQAVVNEIHAPMPGQILSVKLKNGQQIKENDPLLILEAMKMENVLLSPRDGIIKKVHISNKDVVEKGQLLVEFESE